MKVPMISLLTPEMKAQLQKVATENKNQPVSRNRYLRRPRREGKRDERV